jgi:hypothetical protein
MTTYTKRKNAVPKHVVRHDWFSINKDTAIIFARTALEIKGSVGAQPVAMFGMMQHSNPFINLFVSKLLAILNLKWNGSNVIPSNKRLLE